MRLVCHKRYMEIIPDNDIEKVYLSDVLGYGNLPKASVGSTATMERECFNDGVEPLDRVKLQRFEVAP